MSCKLLAVLMGSMLVVGHAAPARSDSEALCKEAKARAVGKKASSLHKAFGRNAKSPNPARLAQEISKAESRFSGSFSRAEVRGGCLTSDDSAGMEAKVNALLEDVMAKVSAVTTTTASTTTSPPSSSTITATTVPGPTTTTVPPLCGVDSKCVFVTADTWDGNLSGLNGADSKCNTAAENGVAWLLGKEFRAWLSDRQTDASTRLTHATVPYRLVDGTLVANDWDDLIDGELSHPIDLTELNTDPFGAVYVWTGTNFDGTTYTPLFPPSSLCIDWTVSWWDTLVGTVSSQDELWTAYGRWLSDETMCGKQYHLYCLQQ